MIKLNLTCIKFFLAVVLSFEVLSASAATRYSVATGNWNANSTWSAASGGAPGASFPVAGDIVFIENGNSITVTANAACASITYPDQATNPTLTVNATFTLTVSGAVTIREFEGVLDGVVTISGGGSLVCASVTIGESPYNPGAKAIALQSIISTIAVLNISGNLNILSPYKTALKLRNSVFSLNAGTVTVGGSVTSINEGASNISTLTMATGAQTGTLILSGATPFNLSLTGTNTITLNGTSALVNYNRAGAQTVYATTYTNLTLSGSGAKTITGATINGILSMEGTATATGSSPAFGAAATLRYLGSASQITGVEFPATFSGTGGVIINNINGVSLNSSKTINSILTLTSGTFSLGANTLTLANGSNLSYGAGSLTGGATSNLTIGTGANIILNAISGGLNNFNTSRNITLGADLSANGTLTLTAGTLTVGANTLTLNGPTIAGTPTNLTTTTASSLTFGGSSAGVLIPVSVTNLNNLTINNANGVTIQGPLNITGIVSPQNGNLSSGGFLTLISTAAQTALIDGSGAGTVTGNVTMQRYLPVGFGYKYFSSSFQGATVNEFGDDMDLAASFPTFYEYDESRTSAGWVSYTNPASVLSPLHGYAVNFGSSVAAKTVDVTGVVNNGALSRTLNNNNNLYTQGFNLTGNPYPSPINWDAIAGWTKTNIDNALYYFKASGADEYSGTYGTYVNGISSDGKATNIIPSMQGFFVHVSNGPPWPVAGTLAMDNRVRITDQTHSFLKSDGKNRISLFRLVAGFSDDTASYDPMAIYFDEKATAEFESLLDAHKLMNTTPLTPNLYSIIPGGNNLAINALPLPQDSLLIIPVGLKIAKSGNIKFRIAEISNLPSEIKILLHDEVTGTDHVLNLLKEFSIYLATGEYNDRFSLRFVKGTTDIPESRPGTDLLNMYNSKSSLRADIKELYGNKGTIIINNISGQIVFRKEIYEAGYHEFNPQLINGIYIVNFITGNIRDTKKILILN